MLFDYQPSFLSVGSLSVYDDPAWADGFHYPDASCCFGSIDILYVYIYIYQFIKKSFLKFNLRI